MSTNGDVKYRDFWIFHSGSERYRVEGNTMLEYTSLANAKSAIDLRIKQKASKNAVLGVLLSEQHSRKFSFNAIRRKLNANRGSLNSAIHCGLTELLRDFTIGSVYHTVLGPLYYIVGSKQDPDYSGD